MLQSLYSSVSGLNALNAKISVISDNITNFETTGYKAENISFAEALSNSISGMAGTAQGIGVRTQDMTQTWTTGNLAETGDSNDLAITGSGFFIVEGAAGESLFTRDGSFAYNSVGQMVTADGLVVQGYSINDDGTIGSLGDITLSDGFIAATPTTEISATVNLDSGATAGSSYSTTIDVYDSLGDSIPVQLTFTKSSTSNEWTWTAGVPSSTGTATGSGTLSFDSEGNLQSDTNPEITLTLTNGAESSQVITWTLFDAGGSSNGSLTQLATDSGTASTTQNGAAAGKRVSVSVDEKGVLTGTYSNGETKALYQIALADFPNCDGLTKSGSNLYEATSDSGQAVIGTPGSGAYGSLSSGSLEMSNVDLASEMADMIVAQRAYEACAKMFTTTDEMLKTLVNIR
jgi:flagellar hook protein FlgE